MLDRELVIGTRDGAFQKAPDVLDAVGMHPTLDQRTRQYPLFLGVVDCQMVGVMVSDPMIGHEIIGDNELRVRGRVFLDEPMERLAGGVADHLQPDLAPTLHNPDHDGFPVTRGEVTAWAYSAPLATDIGFINLDRPVELGSIMLSHGSTDAVVKIPCGLVGDAQDALHLVRGDTFLGFDGQIDRGEPLVQGQVGIVENGVRGHGELIAAGIAFQLVPLVDAGDGRALAVGASEALRPPQFLQERPAFVLAMEASH